MKRFLRNRLGALGLGIVLIVCVVGIVGRLVAPFNPLYQNFTALMVPPLTKGHYLGTDQLGRDIFSRILAGASYTLILGVVITGIEIVIGMVLGVVAGFYRGYWDAVITKIIDVTLAIPNLIFALVIVSIGKPGMLSVIIAIGAVGWRGFARIARGETLKIRQQPYIEASRAYGAGNLRIILRHVVPNLLPIVIIYASLYIPQAILTAAALSFLGLGIQPPNPEWGLMIASGRSYLNQAWWIATCPGLALMVTVLGFNFLGDGLRDVLDPRLRGVI